MIGSVGEPVRIRNLQPDSSRDAVVREGKIHNHKQPLRPARHWVANLSANAPRSSYRLPMDLQTRDKRWLATIKLTETIVRNTLVFEEGRRQAGNPIPEEGHQIFADAAVFEMRLVAEADPIPEDSDLHGVLGSLTQALQGIAIGPNFKVSLEDLLSALEVARAALEHWTGDGQEKIADIVDELERAFLISLIIALTSHGQLSDLVEKMREHHQDFLQGKQKHDVPHYLDIRTRLPVSGPGLGRVHMQHISSALNSGATVFVAGTAPTPVANYPELQSIVYAQWFAFMHAIWDEQFRGRLANHFDTPDRRVRRGDLLNDYFGDIRLIRNDFVHNKGLVDEAVNTRLLQWDFVRGEPLNITTGQMMSLIELFPREALSQPPEQVQVSSGKRTNPPGSIDPDLALAFIEKARKQKMDKGAAMDAAIQLWLADECN